MTLLEPRSGVAFLREAARAMELSVEVFRQRHDEYAGPPSDTVTVRALRLPPGDLAALATPGGQVIVFGAELPEAAALRPAGSPATGVHLYRRP